jgi:hypothetical protein
LKTSDNEGRSGVSTAVIAVAVVVVIVIAGVAGYLALSSPSASTSSSTPSTTSSSSGSSKSSGSTSTSSQTASFGGNSSQQTTIVGEIATMQKDFDARDISSVDKFYTQTSVVNWYGETNGLGSIQQGAGNIQLLYAASLGSTTILKANFTHVQTALVNPNQVNATSMITMTGHSTVVGNLNATVLVSQEWVQSGGTWTIQKEDWDYTLFTVQNAGESTVFPQWSLSLSGVNPNLASMHVIEWNYAPYAAAALYVGLAAILLTALWTRRKRSAAG